MRGDCFALRGQFLFFPIAGTATSATRIRPTTSNYGSRRCSTPTWREAELGKLHDGVPPVRAQTASLTAHGISSARASTLWATVSTPWVRGSSGAPSVSRSSSGRRRWQRHGRHPCLQGPRPCMARRFRSWTQRGLVLRGHRNPSPLGPVRQGPVKALVDRQAP